MLKNLGELVKLFLFLLLGILGSTAHAFECEVEPRLCDFGSFNGNSSSLDLDIYTYSQINKKVRSKIQGKYTIKNNKEKLVSFGADSIQLSKPVRVPFKDILSLSQKAYYEGDQKLAYKILRYTKPNELSIYEAIDKLAYPSPYLNNFNCYLVKKLNLRSSTKKLEDETKECTVLLSDIFVRLGGELKKTNKNISLVDVKSKTCIYVGNTKRCLDLEEFKPYKSTFSLLANASIHYKDRKSELLVVPKVKKK